MKMATRLHHYQNRSVKPFLGGTVVAKDYYDGEPQFIPARGSLLLVPCFSEDPQHEPFVNQCVLITRASYYLANNDYPCVAFYIANDTDIGLLLQKGDQLGAYYPAPHDTVRAERTLLMHSHYRNLVKYGERSYPQPIEDEDEDEEITIIEDEDHEITIFTQPSPPSSPYSQVHQVSSSLGHHPPSPATHPSSFQKVSSLSPSSKKPLQ
jgi:hypothetical protein